MNDIRIKFKSQLDFLIGFVEGRVSGPEFFEALSAVEMKNLLSIFENEKYPASSSHYRRLKVQCPTGFLNAEGIVEDFLNELEVPFDPVLPYWNRASLILSALPEYIDPDDDFIDNHMLPKEELSDAETEKYIRNKAKELFVYVKKRPRWIQSPDWPIEDGIPLVFIGEIPFDAPDLFHDRGTIYVFFDKVKGDFKTICQLY